MHEQQPPCASRNGLMHRSAECRIATCVLVALLIDISDVDYRDGCVAVSANSFPIQSHSRQWEWRPPILYISNLGRGKIALTSAADTAW